jgi:hypothetical protein
MSADPTKRSRRTLSQVAQVAALPIGGHHWKVREVEIDDEEPIAAAIDRTKRSLWSDATCTTSRVRQVHPGRAYMMETLVSVTSAGNVVVGVGLSRVEDAQ